MTRYLIKYQSETKYWYLNVLTYPDMVGDRASVVVSRGVLSPLSGPEVDGAATPEATASVLFILLGSKKAQGFTGLTDP